MAKKKKRSDKSKRLWRILITAVGAALVLIAAVQLALYFFGASAPADVTVRRQGGADDGATPNRRYAWSLDYTFTDKYGCVHNGSTTRRGSDMSVLTDDRAYYFAFAPFVSALENDAKPGFGQLLCAAAGLFLIIVMNRRKKAAGGKKPATCMAAVLEGLEDYDDSVEELYHDDSENK